MRIIERVSNLIYLNSHIPPDEPIDLLNVAFENPRKMKIQMEGNISKRNKREQMPSKDEDTHEAGLMYSVPDRTTGFLEVEELRRTCPGRIWNFVRCSMSIIGTDFYS